jgi:hypothetical protein
MTWAETLGETRKRRKGTKKKPTGTMFFMLVFLPRKNRCRRNNSEEYQSVFAQCQGEFLLIRPLERFPMFSGVWCDFEYGNEL